MHFVLLIFYQVLALSNITLAGTWLTFARMRQQTITRTVCIPRKTLRRAEPPRSPVIDRRLACQPVDFTPAGGGPYWMVVWIMLAYSCWRTHTHIDVYPHSRVGPPSRSPHTYPLGARARPTAAEGSNFGRVRRRIRCRCFRSQATRARSSRVTTPSIHQFIIHLMTAHHSRVRARELTSSRISFARQDFFLSPKADCEIRDMARQNKTES